jgi:DNA-binding MarR family transcriptional regulator
MDGMKEELRDPSVGQLLSQVCRLTAYQMRLKMERVGLHRAQGPALFFLWHHEGTPQSEIARSLHLTAASVTNMLQRMERDGWIERKPDPGDQRVSRVYLTEKAKALHAEAQASFRELDEEIVDVLDADEQTTFRRLLGKIHAQLIARLPEGRHPMPGGVREGGHE